MDELRLPLIKRVSARQWAVLDIVLAIAFFAQAAAVGTRGPLDGAAWGTVRYLAVAAACAALPFRHRFPMAALGVAAPSVALAQALGGSLLLLAVVGLTLYDVAAVSSRRTSLAALAAVIVTIVLAVQMGESAGEGEGPPLIVLLGPAVALAGWLIGENTKARRAYLRGVAQRAAEREREREREERARRAGLEERMRIARELHDVVAHAMSIIAVRSGVARIALDTRPEEARDALGIIEDTSRQALQEMRIMVGVLRGSEPGDAPAGRDPAPGLADLPGLVSQITDTGMAVGVHVEGEPRHLPPGADLSAYRIIQEALTNVVRHAGPAASAELTMRYLPAEVVIEVTDDGRARDQARLPALAGPGTGHGLAGMRERVAAYGGTLVAEPTPRGFRVLARIPADEARP
ncbi:MAG: sensor histidine kinase [Streptosporangiaceae bacterium]